MSKKEDLKVTLLHNEVHNYMPYFLNFGTRNSCVRGIRRLTQMQIQSLVLEITRFIFT